MFENAAFTPFPLRSNFLLLFSSCLVDPLCNGLCQFYDNRYERSTTCGDQSAFEWSVIIGRETFSRSNCSLQTNPATGSELESTLLFN